MIMRLMFFFLVLSVPLLKGQDTLYSFYDSFDSDDNRNLWEANLDIDEMGNRIFEYNWDSNQGFMVKVNQESPADMQIIDFKTKNDFILDLTQNPYISFFLKIEGGKYGNENIDTIPITIDLYSRDEAGELKKQVLGITKYIPTNEYIKGLFYEFDFSDNFGKNDIDGSTLENELSDIEAITISSTLYPNVFKFDYILNHFKIGQAAKPLDVLTTYTEDFNNPIDMNLWAPYKSSDPDNPIYIVSQVDSTLHISMKQQEFYQTQVYNFAEQLGVRFDLTTVPLVSFDIKVEELALLGDNTVDSVNLILPFYGPNEFGDLQNEFVANSVFIPTDGQWHHYSFDIRTQGGCFEHLDNDLSEIQAVGISFMSYPDNYTFDYELDNFKLGHDAIPMGEAISHKEIPEITERFKAQWTINPSHSKVNGISGLSSNITETDEDYGIAVKFDSDGFIKANNGTEYGAINMVPYEVNQVYTIQIRGDLKTKSYDIFIKSQNKSKVLLADNYRINIEDNESFKFLCMNMLEDTTQIDILNTRLRPSFMLDDYYLYLTNNIESNLGFTKLQNIRFTATVTQIPIRANIVFSEDLESKSVSILIRPRISILDNNTYKSLTEYYAKVGKKIFFDITLDIEENLYSVWITPEGENRILLAEDFSFKRETDIINYINTSNTAYFKGEKNGKLVISDIEYTVGNKDIEYTDVKIYPNPTSDYLIIESKEDINNIEIINIKGDIIKIIDKNSNSNSQIYIKDLIDGTYVIRYNIGNTLYSEIFFKN